MANALLEKLSLPKLMTKPTKPIRIMVVGQEGVGKTALVVRLITKRFIGDYDNSTEKIYSYSAIIDKERVAVEIIDTPSIRNTGYATEAEMNALEKNMQSADAFILMYSVTDKGSFEDCCRLRLLISLNKSDTRRWSLLNRFNSVGQDWAMETPVILVGNKKDQINERVVRLSDGQERYQKISCAGFYEISVRESAEEVSTVFQDLCRSWRLFAKNPKLKRSPSDVQSYTLSPDTTSHIYFESLFRNGKRNSFLGLRTSTSSHEPSIDEQHRTYIEDLANRYQSASPTDGNQPSSRVKKSPFNQLTPFRQRASTDGKILSRPRRPFGMSQFGRFGRRMSISLRGNSTPPPPTSEAT